METIIKAKLREIENERDVRILYACESGSRAWGFASPDSDWDVRFIYLPKPEWYLTIAAGRDVIEEPINDDLDISGWELRKALNLLRKSNPPLLEWLDSPILYHVDETFLTELRELIPMFFSAQACLYHYLSMAKSNFRAYLEGKEDVRLKKYLYALRPMLACLWLERELGPVPMKFEKLVDEMLEPGRLKDEVDKLVALKKQSSEMGTSTRIEPINTFLEKEIARLAGGAIASEAVKPDVVLLDNLLRSTLKRTWGIPIG